MFDLSRVLFFPVRLDTCVGVPVPKHPRPLKEGANFGFEPYPASCILPESWQQGRCHTFYLRAIGGDGGELRRSAFGCCGQNRRKMADLATCHSPLPEPGAHKWPDGPFHIATRSFERGFGFGLGHFWVMSVENAILRSFEGGIW